MPKGITLNREFYSYDSLKQNSDAGHEDEYFNEVLKFCHTWLNGLEQVELNTSGSTGAPKTIQFSKAQLLASVQGTEKALQLTHDDKALICINTSYVGGRMMLIRAMEIKMDAHVIPPSANPLKEVEENEGFTFFSFVPLQIQTILENDQHTFLQGGKAIIIGGGSLDKETCQQLKSLDTPAYHTFGMTETASHIALKRINGEEPDPSFETLPGIEIETDERECLRIRGAQTNLEWIQTNDLVRILTPRKFEWIGRIDDVINTGGVKVYILELEEKIKPYMQQYAGSDKYVISKVHDPKLGEKIVLVVEFDLGAEVKKNLLAELSSTLPKYHEPKELIIIDQIPYTETGKIKRKMVEELINDPSA